MSKKLSKARVPTLEEEMLRKRKISLMSLLIWKQWKKCLFCLLIRKSGKAIFKKNCCQFMNMRKNSGDKEGGNNGCYKGIITLNFSTDVLMV
jgi:hypothetical protein